MSGQGMSLRDSVLETLRLFFTQLMATLEALEDTPSTPIVARKLTEAFHREEEAMGKLCDEMEARLRAHMESYLSTWKDAVNASVDEIKYGMKQSADFGSGRQHLDKINQTMPALSEINQQHEMFVERLRMEFGRESAAIINKFRAEADSILTESYLADVAIISHNPNRSPKN
jgi:hypothetical protein